MEKENSRALSEDSYLFNQMQLTLSSDLNTNIRLKQAIEHTVANTGHLVFGELPTNDYGLSEEDIRNRFNEMLLRAAVALIYEARVVEQAGAWSDGSLAKEALRKYLIGVRSNDERHAIKRASEADLITLIEQENKLLAYQIRINGWESRVTLEEMSKMFSYYESLISPEG